MSEIPCLALVNESYRLCAGELLVINQELSRIWRVGFEYFIPIWLDLMQQHVEEQNAVNFVRLALVDGKAKLR